MVNGPHSPDRAHQVGRARRARPGRGLAAPTSPRRSSARAPTRPTRTSPGPPPSPASAAAHGLRPRPSCSSRPAPSRCGPPSSATACWPTSRPSAPPCSPTPAAPASASGAARTSPTAAQHDRQQLQPQLPQAQRRQRQHAGLRDQPRDGGGPGPGRHPRLRPPHRHADRRATAARSGSSRPVGEQLPGRGLRPRRVGLRRPRPSDGGGRRGRRWRPTASGSSCSSPFAPWDGQDFVDLPVLMKAAGKCTTDHISAAGPWLRFRGHLENISGNLFLGVVNAFSGRRGRPRQGPARRRDRARSPTSPAPPRAGRGLVRRRRRELRRGQLPASTPPWSPGSAAAR